MIRSCIGFVLVVFVVSAGAQTPTEAWVCAGGKGIYKRAIDDFSRSIGLNKNTSRVGDSLDVGTTLANRCEARALAGDFTRALADCNEAIKLEPNETVPLGSRGFVYLKMAKIDEALSDF